MIIVLEISAQSRETLARFGVLADRIPGLLRGGLRASGHAAATSVGEQLITGQLALKSRGAMTGIAGQLASWDEDEQTVAVGIPAEAPAYKYAGIQEKGGTILPRNAKALAIPISDEAKRHTSPRDMDDLTMIARPGRPPLLVQILEAKGFRKAQWRIHWVLVPSVTLPATHWLSSGVVNAMPIMVQAMQHYLDGEVAGNQEAGNRN